MPSFYILNHIGQEHTVIENDKKSIAIARYIQEATDIFRDTNNCHMPEEKSTHENFRVLTEERIE